VQHILHWTHLLQVVPEEYSREQGHIHQKFAVTDQRIVWYGSSNLLSFGNAEESIMRLESPNIANELMKTIFIS
jgi:phosphatidylserine/phosphatidylglycerophosphate/cardiolipin synthase-like enzyme